MNCPNIAEHTRWKSKIHSFTEPIILSRIFYTDVLTDNSIYMFLKEYCKLTFYKQTRFNTGEVDITYPVVYRISFFSHVLLNVYHTMVHVGHVVHIHGMEISYYWSFVRRLSLPSQRASNAEL